MSDDQKYHEKNAAVIQTPPKRRIATATRFFLIPILAIFSVVQILTVDAIASTRDDADAMSESAVNRRIAPVAGFVLVDPNAPKTATTDAAPAATSAPPLAAAQPTENAAPPAETPAAAEPTTSAASQPPGDTINPAGKRLYNTNCFACHNAGIAGAPKFGDKAAWAPYIATGMDAMMKIVINGKGAMPPKGGAMNAPDEDLRAAVEYMMNAAK